MKKALVFGCVLVVSAAVAAGGYTVLTPKVGHASEAEIMAALPASLKVKDAPDPTAEARYARLMEIVKGLDKKPLGVVKPGEGPGRSTAANEAILGRIDGLLEKGDLRAPTLKGDALFPELVGFKNAAKLMGLAAKDAQERGDRAACARWTTLGLRFARALEGSGGVVIHQLVAVAIKSIAVRSAYLAEIGGGLDAPGRAEVLALLPPRDGRSPAMAAAVRRDFQWGWIPVLLHPEDHRKELMDYEVPIGPNGDETSPRPAFAGTFDPVASARLGGAVYAATIDDLSRPWTEVTHEDVRLAEAAAKGLPDLPGEGAEGGSARLWSDFLYRLRMNAGSNTLGRRAASQGVLTQMSDATAREIAHENLVRAVFLLRTTGKASVRDSYTKGDLRFDPKRKVVWSVGKDGKDDGGQIGRGFENGAPDLGYPYGDHSWPPKAARAPGGPLGVPGMPPPGLRNNP